MNTSSADVTAAGEVAAHCWETDLLMRDEKWDELEVQKQAYDVNELWSPQPSDMSRTMVLSGRSAHDGKAEYSGTLLMKMEVR